MSSIILGLAILAIILLGLQRINDTLKKILVELQEQGEGASRQRERGLEYQYTALTGKAPSTWAKPSPPPAATEAPLAVASDRSVAPRL